MFDSGLPSPQIYSIAIDQGGNKWLSTPDGLAVYREGGVVSVEDREDARAALPVGSVLHQNYPNPFNPSTWMRFELPHDGFARLDVYDLLGRRVDTVFAGQLQAGSHAYSWDAGRFSSGVYMYRLTTDTGSATRILTVLR